MWREFSSFVGSVICSINAYSMLGLQEKKKSPIIFLKWNRLTLKTIHCLLEMVHTQALCIAICLRVFFCSVSQTQTFCSALLLPALSNILFLIRGNLKHFLSYVVVFFFSETEKVLNSIFNPRGPNCRGYMLSRTDSSLTIYFWKRFWYSAAFFNVGLF